MNITLNNLATFFRKTQKKKRELKQAQKLREEKEPKINYKPPIAILDSEAFHNLKIGKLPAKETSQVVDSNTGSSSLSQADSNSLNRQYYQVQAPERAQITPILPKIPISEFKPAAACDQSFNPQLSYPKFREGAVINSSNK